jgi:hypothetical protein
MEFHQASILVMNNGKDNIDTYTHIGEHPYLKIANFLARAKFGRTLNAPPE